MRLVFLTSSALPSGRTAACAALPVAQMPPPLSHHVWACHRFKTLHECQGRNVRWSGSPHREWGRFLGWEGLMRSRIMSYLEEKLRTSHPKALAGVQFAAGWHAHKVCL